MIYLPIKLRHFTGQSPADKIIKVREEMKKKKAKAVVVTMLDEVAWLFNLRGSDIDYNPGKQLCPISPYVTHNKFE